ncbi:MAG: FAD-dependent oxidoreductase [Planctomycetota bacterium]|nr:FAD-dependent oxidoreductase [Planctomycetota bacterium]
MTSFNARSIAILGAGPAGMATAYRLRKAGHTVTVFEAKNQVGGMASSFLFEGHTVDFGSHRLHPSCEPQILNDLEQLLAKHDMGSLQLQKRRGRLYINENTLPYPITLTGLITQLGARFLLNMLFDQFTKTKSNGSLATLESEIRRQFGRVLAESFYFPYIRKVWGVEPGELSADLVKIRISEGSNKGLWRKILKVARRKGHHYYYPSAGFGSITESYKKEYLGSGGELILNSKIQSLKLTESSATIFCNGEAKAFDIVLSSIPLPILHSLIGNSELKDSLVYRSLTLLYLHLRQEQWSEEDAHYFPNDDIIVSRISETKNFHKTRSEAPGTVLCCEIPCQEDDAIYQSKAATLTEKIAKALPNYEKSLGSILASKVIRLNKAYPIFNSSYKERLALVEAQLNPYKRLICFGRHGLFAHDNTHHSLRQAYQLADCFNDSVFDRDHWQSKKAYFKDHFVED